MSKRKRETQAAKQNSTSTSNQTSQALAQEDSAVAELVESFPQCSMSDQNAAYGGARPKVRTGSTGNATGVSGTGGTLPTSPECPPPSNFDVQQEDIRARAKRPLEAEDLSVQRKCTTNRKELEELGGVTCPHDPPEEEMLSVHAQRMIKGDHFYVGDVILECVPFVYVLCQKYKTTRCDRCLYKLRKKVQCEKCRFVYYCSSKCKEEAWKEQHKFECERLQNLEGKNISDRQRYMALLLMILLAPESEGIYDQVGHYRVSFTELESHEDILKIPPYQNEVHESFQFLQEYLGTSWTVPFYKYRIIYAKAMVHSVDIYSCGALFIGIGLYLGVTMFRNACLPTACMVFMGPVLRLTCIEEMPQINTNLVTVNRYQIARPQEDRRRELKQEYFTDCICRLCWDPAYAQIMEERIDIRKADEVALQLMPIISSIVVNDSSTEEGLHSIIQSCEQFFKLIYGVLGKFHYIRVKIMRIFVDALFDAGQFPKLNYRSLKYLDICKFYFGLLHPKIPHILFLHAQALLHQGETDRAKDIMKEGIELVRICYGKDHPFYKYMIKVNRDCAKVNWQMVAIGRTYPGRFDDY